MTSPDSNQATAIARAVAAWLRTAAAWLMSAAKRLRDKAQPVSRRAWSVAVGDVRPVWAKVAPRLAVVVEKVRAVLPADVLRFASRNGMRGEDQPTSPRMRRLQIGLSVAGVSVIALVIGSVAATARHEPQASADAALRMLQPVPQATASVPPPRSTENLASSGPAAPATSTTAQQPAAPKTTAPSSTSDAPATPTEPGPEYGIDVSNYNGDINWDAVAANGKRFAYVEATDGEGFTNPLFKQQFKGAKDAGLLVGAYHFARPFGSARAQADTMLSAIDYQADGKTLPPELDLEVNPADGGCYGLSAGEMQDWVKAFDARVKDATGTDVMLYANSSFWNQCMGGTEDFKSSNPLSLAAYGSGAPPSPGGWDHYTIWQNSEYGRVNGVSGDVDLDVFNGSLDQLKKFTRN